VLQALVCYRLLDPGSEWRLHRVWFEQSAMGDLLAEDFSIAAKDTLYRCLDFLVQYKDELFEFLHQRWAALFGAKYDVLLYDLTSTYFESDPPFPEDDKRRFGHSRDKRPDCVQVVIALIITPEGLPERIEAHIFVAFLAFCLHATLRRKLQLRAPGLTPRSVLEQLSAIQMLDVHFPTTDGRWLIFCRYTSPNKLQKLLIGQLALELPAQSPPRITSRRWLEPLSSQSRL
jgi:hypothetical protein